MATHLYFVHALSPVHCGTGQAVSGIDLPIAREKPTGIPLAPGSSIKGVLRAEAGGYAAGAEPAAKDIHLAAFGPETENAADYAGALQFSDANLLFLPTRSVRGTFGWVTSPYQLRRLARDVAEAKLPWKVPLLEPKDEECLVTGDRLVVIAGKNERVVFEDFDFAPNTKHATELSAFATDLGRALFGRDGAAAQSNLDHFVQRVAVLSDDVMRVLVRVGMEVTARNRISNDTKTVEAGALWTEEALPIESILVGVLAATPVQRRDRERQLERYSEPALVEHVRSLCSRGLQIGGKSSVGRGLCRIEVL